MPKTPTKRAYDGLDAAYYHFNKQLFRSRLPPCLITVRPHRGLPGPGTPRVKHPPNHLRQSPQAVGFGMQAEPAAGIGRGMYIGVLGGDPSVKPSLKTLQ